MGELAVDRGMVVLRASRLEALLRPLHLMLEASRPDNPLAPQLVVAAHPGMKPWLVGELARHVGPGRIVANLDIQLPSTWLDGLATHWLGQRAVALPHFRKSSLRWTLHALLEGKSLPKGVCDPRILGYLQPGGAAATEDDLARRRFQLSDRLAGVYSQYLVYRPDWLAAWEAGKDRFATARFDGEALACLEQELLAPLWRALQSRLGDHRGKLVRELTQALDAHAGSLEPLHVFGVSHMPPMELAVLRAYARHAPVMLYVPDPCREFWAGLFKACAKAPSLARADLPAWATYAREEAGRLDDAQAGYWHEQGHPLLSRWGRMGQHFFSSLVEEDVVEDQRHAADEATTLPSNRLERLQESIRQLKPELLQENAAALAAREDASLRIHACHTRLRELEVLRDALLDAMDKDGVLAGEIVVMAPDIQAYLPLIPTVFGEPGSARERHLPYHLADVPVARGHGLFHALASLLDLPASRITAPEVADLLDVEEIRRAMAMDGNDVDTALDWIRRSHVAWSMGPAHKQSLGLPPVSEASFAWAIDRMIAGYVMSDAPDEDGQSPIDLADGTRLLPLPGISGPAASALGGLDRLLREVAHWQAMARQTLPASAWARTLQARVDALFHIDRTDAEARDALSAIHRAIASLAAEPARNDEDPLLRFVVVRDLLLDAMAAVPERQRFLMGGVTFCGMVPQRAIPFAVVCVLGLNDGEFPRPRPDGGLDLMARLRRIGDRDIPTDDRYLFLETIMSARKRLHLGYIGQGVRDGKHRNPAAPLAELMMELDQAAGLAGDAEDDKRPWLVRHPLQPFDARYFTDGDPRLFTYAKRFEGLSAAGRGPLPGFRDGSLSPAGPMPAEVPLQSLHGYFKSPAREILRDRVQLSLDAIDPDGGLPESEPLESIGRIHSVARKVFFAEALPMVAQGHGWDGQAPPSWVSLSGILPAGKAGEQAWKDESGAVRALAAAALATGRFDGRSATGGRSLPVDVELPAKDAGEPGLRVFGSVANVIPLAGSDDGLQLVLAYPVADPNKKRLKAAADIDFGELVPAFLQWALLRLDADTAPAPADAPRPVRLTMLADPEPALAVAAWDWDVAYCAASEARRADMARDLGQRVRALVELWHRAGTGDVCYYPATGWEALRAFNKACLDGADSAADEDWIGKVASAAASAWGSGDDDRGERNRAPGYEGLLEGGLAFGDEESDPGYVATKALLDVARELERLLCLPVPGQGMPA